MIILKTQVKKREMRMKMRNTMRRSMIVKRNRKTISSKRSGMLIKLLRKYKSSSLLMELSLLSMMNMGCLKMMDLITNNSLLLMI